MSSSDGQHHPVPILIPRVEGSTQHLPSITPTDVDLLAEFADAVRRAQTALAVATGAIPSPLPCFVCGQGRRDQPRTKRPAEDEPDLCRFVGSADVAGWWYLFPRAHIAFT